MLINELLFTFLSNSFRCKTSSSPRWILLLFLAIEKKIIEEHVSLNLKILFEENYLEFFFLFLSQQFLCNECNYNWL
jgi:hypothetical protein